MFIRPFSTNVRQRLQQGHNFSTSSNCTASEWLRWPEYWEKEVWWTWSVVGNHVSWAVIFIVFMCSEDQYKYVFLFWIKRLKECKLDYKILIMIGAIGYPVDVELASCYIVDVLSWFGFFLSMSLWFPYTVLCKSVIILTICFKIFRHNVDKYF